MIKEFDPLEEIEVVARFEPTERISPLKFTWRQVEFPVTSVGRSWQDDAGHHILVMVPGDMLGSPGEQVVELVYQPGDGRWWLRQPPRPRAA